MTFKIENVVGFKDGMAYSKVVTFYKDCTNIIEAEYYYVDSKVNWLLSWGFTKGSLNESRKQKANKLKKPYFNLKQGWYK